MSRFMKSALLASGAVAVRANGDDQLTELFTQLSTGFEEFKATMEEKSQGVEKRFDDVVTSEKLERINADISKAQELHEQELAKINAALSSLEINGGGDGGEQVSPEMVEFNTAFDEFIRTGSQESEAKVKAAMRSGGVMAAMSVGSDPDGGVTAPVEWDRKITDKLKIVSEMRRYAQTQTVGGQGYRHAYNKRGMAAGWVGETAGRPGTDTGEFALYDFAFGEVYANPGVTQGLLDDSAIDIEAYVANEVDEEFASLEGIAFVSGDGVNKPKGVMQYSAAAEGALAANLQHPLGPVSEINSGHVSQVTADGLIDLVYDVPDKRMSDQSSFYANKTTHGEIRKLKNADGDYIWQPPFQAGQPATILGHGARTLSGMPDIAANAMPILFGDLGRAYRIFDRKGVRVLRNPYSNAPYVHFYTTKRVGGGLWNAEWIRYHKIAA